VRVGVARDFTRHGRVALLVAISDLVSAYPRRNSGLTLRRFPHEIHGVKVSETTGSPRGLANEG
jgi:hypothetical protein